MSTFHRLILTLCLTTTLLSPFYACSETKSNEGTLIVTYNTGPNLPRLDRIRFWLVNDKHERCLYPKENTFIDDNETKTRMVLIEHLPEGNYALEFVIPNTDLFFEDVPTRKFKIAPQKIVKINQQIKVKGDEFAYNNDADAILYADVKNPNKLSNNEIQLVHVAAGPSIMGDPFKEGIKNELAAKTVEISSYNIGKYEVTNTEFTKWLNKAFKEGKIYYIDHGEKIGTVINDEKKLLFKTAVAEAESQITFDNSEKQALPFKTIPGKGQLPVIFVTWYGAEAFCKDMGYRLPTEAEWEKCAGMDVPNDPKNLKKFRYGFGRNEIDGTWANYKTNDRPITKKGVLTTPVGFYNGSNLVPSKTNNGKQIQTHDAQSPYGAYDMSGNVWEWVGDWYGDSYPADMAKEDPKGPKEGVERVLKGGCYDSLASGVRVAERLAAPPEYCDAFSGFRVAN